MPTTCSQTADRSGLAQWLYRGVAHSDFAARVKTINALPNDLLTILMFSVAQLHETCGSPRCRSRSMNDLSMTARLSLEDPARRDRAARPMRRGQLRLECR